MELRLALCLCVVLGCALCGRAMADVARRRERTLAVLAEAVRALKVHMTGMLEPVRRALEGVDCPLMALVASAMEDGSSAEEAWRRVRARAIKRGGCADALNDGDLQIPDRLFSHLGQTGREEQEALLNAAVRALEERRADALESARQADRLYPALGLLTGIMLALIVI